MPDQHLAVAWRSEPGRRLIRAALSAGMGIPACAAEREVMADVGPQIDARRELLADLRQRFAAHWQIPLLAASLVALVLAGVLAALPRAEDVPPSDLLQRAEAALSEKRFVLADHLAEEFIRRYPEVAATEPLVHRIQGTAAFELALMTSDEAQRRDLLNKSRAAYSAAIAQEPGQQPPVAMLERLARSAMMLKQYDEAVKALEQAIAQDPPQVFALELMRIEALRKMEPVETEAILADLAESRQAVARQLGVMQRDLEATAANATMARQRIVDRMVELKDDLAQLVVVESEVLSQQGDHEQAEQKLQKVIDDEHADERTLRQVLLALAEAQGGQGKWTQVLDTLDEVLAMSAGTSSEAADARAHLMKGRAYYSQQNYDAAIDQYKLTASLFPSAAEGLAARLGMAEAYLVVDDADRAHDVLAKVVPEVRDRAQVGELIDQAAVRQMLRVQVEMNLLRGNLANALRYVLLEEKLVPEPDRELLVRKAAVLNQVAEQQAVAAALAEPGSEEATDLRLSAERNWKQTGDIYSRIAETFDATTQYDYGHSRWAASRAYLQAGAHERTAAALKQFVAEQPLDNRVPQARLDLAREYEVLNRWEEAIGVYSSLVDESPSSLAGFEGRYRLAVALIRSGPDGYEQAEEELLGLVERSDQVLPESVWYRRSLFELGRLMHLRDRHDEALMRLSEFVQRYPNDEQCLSAQYLIAQSVRSQGLAALERSRTADQVLERKAAAEIAAQKLNHAVAEMQRLVDVYERIEPDALTPLAASEQRTLLFDLADTLSRLNRAEDAIAIYDQIVVRYQTSPAAMSAYSRLAAEYRKIGRRDQLMAVLERARWTLQKISDDSFAAEPGMSRAFWEYWLETMQL